MAKNKQTESHINCIYIHTHAWEILDSHLKKMTSRPIRMQNWKKSFGISCQGMVYCSSRAPQCLKTPCIFPATIRVGTNTGACIIIISFTIHGTSLIPPEFSAELESLPSSENQFPSLLPVLQIGVLLHSLYSSGRTTTWALWWYRSKRRHFGGFNTGNDRLAVRIDSVLRSGFVCLSYSRQQKCVGSLTLGKTARYEMWWMLRLLWL
jgi:hypothetical protein